MKKKLAAYLTGLMVLSGTAAFAAIPSADIAIGGIKPGMSIDTAIAAFGQPTYRYNDEDVYFANGIEIELYDHAPETIKEIKLSSQSNVATPAGLTVGSPESVVTEAYGQPDELEPDDGKNKYTYYANDNTMRLKIVAMNGSVIEIECEYKD